MSEGLIIGSKICRLFGVEGPRCVLVQLSARHETGSLEEEAAQLSAIADVPFLLVTIELEDWTVDLMPWADGNISRDPEAGRHGQKTLQYILQELLPELQRRYGPMPVILGGYSLGGLFALWASCQTDTFAAVAAASPSVWIHGWLPYAKKHVPMAGSIYLSLGDREEHVKNQAIARVGDNLRNYYELIRQQLGADRCTLVWEQGGHFNDNPARLARAFAWCLERVNQNAYTKM
jgi:predicted alpha/beta superfamily hydrolase